MKPKRDTVLGHRAPGARPSFLGVVLLMGAVSLTVLAVMTLLGLALK